MYTITSKFQEVRIVLLALLLTYGIVVNTAFPYLGFAVGWSVVSLIVFLQKPHRDIFVRLIFGLSVALSLCLVWRANPLLTFLNLIGAVGMTSLLALVHDDSKLPGFIRMLFSPLIVFSRVMQSKVKYSLSLSVEKSSGFLQKLRFQETFPSLLVTVIALIIIVPLLAGSNPFFKNLVDELFALLNFSRLLDKIIAIEITGWTVFQLVIFVSLLMFIPRLYGYLASQVAISAKAELTERIMLLPKFVIAGVLLLFFATQVQLYFASDAQLLAVGSTPSERTNEVFGQLSVVTAVIIGLLYYFRSYTVLDRKITYVLLVETLFLTAIAFSSVYQYSANFGFTFKRLWGLAGVFWLVAVLVLYARVYWKKYASEYFLQSVLVLSAATLVCINITNFDYLIAHVHQPRTGEGIDYDYLKHLSADARTYELRLERINLAEQQAKTTEDWAYLQYVHSGLSRDLVWLQEKYKNPDLRTVNIGEFRAYQTIREYDVAAAEARLGAREAEARQRELELLTQ